MGLWNSPEADGTLGGHLPSEKGLACCCKHNGRDYTRKPGCSGIYFSARYAVW